MNLKKVVQTQREQQRTAPATTPVDKKVWVTLKEIETILGRSLYRCRTLGWEGHFGDQHKPDKLVYYRRDAVLAYKVIQDSRGNRNDELDDTRLGKRVKSSCELVTLLISEDTALTAEQKKGITTIIATYIKEAEAMIKEK